MCSETIQLDTLSSFLPDPPSLVWQPFDTGHGNTNQHLTNNKGTVIYLTGRTSGLSTNYGIGKFIIGLE